MLNLKILLLLVLVLQFLLDLSLIFLRSFSAEHFLWGGVVRPTLSPQPEGLGYPLLSGSSLLTCLAWETLGDTFKGKDFSRTATQSSPPPQVLLHYMPVPFLPNSLPSRLIPTLLMFDLVFNESLPFQKERRHSCATETGGKK
jgi:hypothetical protein